jgi:hypothetical protein
MNTTVARNISYIRIMANEPRGVAPGANRGTSSSKTGLRAKGSVFLESLAVVVLGHLKHEVVVANEASSSVLGFERDATAVSKTGANDPAGLLFESGSAGRGDDLSVDCGSGVSEVTVGEAGCGSPERDGRTNSQCWAADQGSGSIFGGDDVSLNRVLGGIGGVARCHHTLVESTLGAVAIVTADAENDCTLFVHWVVSSSTGTRTIVVCREGTTCGVSALNGPLVGASLENSGEKTVGYGWIGSVLLWVGTREQAVLQISHHPRSATRSRTPDSVVTKIDSLTIV